MLAAGDVKDEVVRNETMADLDLNEWRWCNEWNGKVIPIHPPSVSYEHIFTLALDAWRGSPEYCPGIRSEVTCFPYCGGTSMIVSTSLTAPHAFLQRTVVPCDMISPSSWLFDQLVLVCLPSPVYSWNVCACDLSQVYGSFTDMPHLYESMQPQQTESSAFKGCVLSSPFAGGTHASFMFLSLIHKNIATLQQVRDGV